MTLLWRLRTALIAAVLPLALLLLWGAYAQWRQGVQQIEHGLTQEARIAATGISGLVASARQATTSLALRVQDEAFDAASCQQYVRALVAAEPQFASAGVVAVDGRMWCQSADALPAPDRDALRVALSSSVPVLAKTTGVDHLTLLAAYRDAGGRALGTALINVDPRRLATAAQVLPGRFAMMVDRPKTLVLPLTALPAADNPLADALSRLASGADVDDADVGLGDASYVVAAAPVPNTGWLVLMGADRATLLAPTRYPLHQTLLVIAAAIGLALVAGSLVAKRLVQRPLDGVLAVARQCAGEPSPAAAPRARASEFDGLRGAVHALAAQVVRAGKGKEAAIRDAHHRMMNSLHLLGAILHLHSRQLDDETVRRHIVEARERVVAVSLIYRHLCESAATQTVDFAALLRGFCAEAAEAHGRTAIEVETEPAELPIEAAMNVALVVHEILARSLKHAAAPDAGGLRVRLRRRDDGVRLEVIDERPGAAAGLAAESSRSLSMMIVQSLSRQLRGRFAVERYGAATVFAVSVPMPETGAGQAGRRAVA